MTNSAAPPRRFGYATGDGLSGGFWRRVIAYWLDHAIAAVALSLIGAALFVPTDGLVRHSSPVIDIPYCVAVDEAGSTNMDRLKALPPPGPFQTFRPERSPDAVRLSRCDALFGDSYVRTTFLWTGDIAYSETVTRPLTPSGRVAPRTLDLAALFFPVLMLWLAVAERAWGGGPGKRLMGLRVIGDDGVSRARLGTTLVRNALLYAPQAAVGLLVALYGLIPPAPGGLMFDPVAGWLVLALGGAAALWNLVVFLAVLFQRPDPFWDRWAGVSVRRRVRIVTD